MSEILEIQRCPPLKKKEKKEIWLVSEATCQGWAGRRGRKKSQYSISPVHLLQLILTDRRVISRQLKLCSQKSGLIPKLLKTKCFIHIYMKTPWSIITYQRGLWWPHTWTLTLDAKVFHRKYQQNGNNMQKNRTADTLKNILALFNKFQKKNKK